MSCPCARFSDLISWLSISLVTESAWHPELRCFHSHCCEGVRRGGTRRGPQCGSVFVIFHLLTLDVTWLLLNGEGPSWWRIALFQAWRWLRMEAAFLALPAGAACVSFTFIYCPTSWEQDLGAKCSSRGLPGPVARSLRSGVASRRAGTHPEHQGLRWPLDLGLWEPFLVCTGGRGSESLNKKEAIKGLCFLLWLQAPVSVRWKSPSTPSLPPSPKNKISFSFW